MVVVDGPQQSLLHICMLIKIFVIEFMFRIFGRIRFIDIPQQPGIRPNICLFQILEFCFKLFDVLLTFFLPDCLIISYSFTLVALQGLRARLVPACTRIYISSKTPRLLQFSYKHISSVTQELKHELIRRWDSERELLRSAPGSYPEFAEITQNNAITPFKVIQGHRFWYQSKAHIRFSVSD